MQRRATGDVRNSIALIGRYFDPAPATGWRRLVGNPSATSGVVRLRQRGRILLVALLVAMVLPLTPVEFVRTTIAAPPSADPSPSVDPSMAPLVEPSTSPSAEPSVAPSVAPSVEPSTSPSAEPTSSPSPKRPATVRTAELAAAATFGDSIVTENALPGNPPSEWDVSGAGDSSIQGFATDISVNRGATVDFKIDTAVDELPHRHLPARLLRRRRRAPGRHDPVLGDHAPQPTGVPVRRYRQHQPDRLRQLGSLGVVGGAC